MKRARFWAVAFAAMSIVTAFAGLKDSDCLDCHGDHTLTKTNAAGKTVPLFVDKNKFAASVHRTNACISCHADVTAKHPDDNVPLKPVNCMICHQRAAASYAASVHGLAARAGHADAATCRDCHDSHEIISNRSPTSPIYFSRQAQTCGACHEREARDWLASVHGQAVVAGSRDAPTCTGCHEEHRIQSLKNVSAAKISGDVCSRCHASERLNTKYNLPADRVKTFFESYHGLAGQYGSTVAANCASCHGFHKILPSSDTNSTISRMQLVTTCGKCHPGASREFASGKIHIAPDGQAAGTDLGSRVNRWVRKVYLALIFFTIGAMALHNGILFLKKTAARLRASVRPVLRMSRGQRWQHFLLGASFTVLAVTGFALRFPDSWLAKMLGANEPFRRWSHRLAGLVLLGVGAYHLVYILTTPDGRRLLRDFFPVKKDLADVWGAVRYLAGRQKEKSKIARFGYAEKMEYWAVIWGTIIMGATGLLIWFNLDVTKFLPRWVIAVSTTVHYYEAVLACLAICVWHFYHVIFDPDVYPANFACLDGKVSREWQHEEHPLELPVPDGQPSRPAAGTSKMSAFENLKHIMPRHLIDQFLLGLFRLRTRGFLRMQPASGAVPPVPADGVGCLYLHVPFCESLCPFCSFHRVLHQRGPARRYFHSLREEIRRYHAAGFRFASAYFGGGTPTTEPEELVETILLVRKLLGVREISVETNPKDLRPEILEPLRAAGVTRLSVGVQSFDDRLLREMERYEKYGSGAEAADQLRRAAGMFPTLNVDLIFNLPHQDLASLERDLEIFSSTGANQVSFYPLMSAPSVQRRMSGSTGLPDPRRRREFYQTILARLKPEFTPSSAWCFTKRGQGSDEYLVEADYYVGVGSGAFSYLAGTLYATTFSLDQYEQRIAQGLTGITGQNRLTIGDQMRYSLLVKMFGLRLDREWAQRRHGKSFFRRVCGELKTLECLGAARRDARGWQLTERGMYWLMLMMCAFFESVNEYRDAMRAHPEAVRADSNVCADLCALSVRK